MDNELYTIDLDENGKLCISEKNFNLIKLCVSLDSAYRNTNEKVEKSAAWYIKNEFYVNGEFVFSKNVVKEVCKRIDREESTHLSVSGTKKGNGNGIDKMAERILDIGKDKFTELIKQGSDYLVEILSRPIGSVRKNSFASKFCVNVSKYALNKYNYVKFDSVICEVLPYYAKKYIGEIHYNKTKSLIKDEFCDKNHFNYNGYRLLIERVIEGVKKKQSDCEFLNNDTFDMMLWYYYKGDLNKGDYYGV